MPHVAARTASRDRDTGRYQSHRPEQTLLYQIVDEYYPAFAALMAEQGKELPGYVQREFEEFLQCGRLEHGFLRVRCESCHAEHLVAFSCKRRGFCPSCGARRMAESAALLVDEVLPEQPMRQGTVAKLAMRQPFVLFKGLTFQKLCLPGAFRPGDHHN
ncbi:transposase zinc-binding domain-containing protein, partial [Escherichia coli]|uniref:transposase zinc-binding domain-containing protein n=1 Tax=Escherichia coli TaxID=562 RepID=UPI001F143270